MKSLMFAAAAAALAFPAEPAAAQPVWAVDLVKVKSGELDHYVSFVKQNWRAAREEAVRRKAILSYRIMVSKASKDGTSSPDLMLMTEYPSQEAYDGREKIFAPIIAARPLVRVDGRSSRDFVISITEMSAIEP